MEHTYQICEKYDPDEVIEPGDLIEVTPEGKYQRTQRKFSGRVVGVCVSEDDIDTSTIEEAELNNLYMRVNDILDQDGHIDPDVDPLPDKQFYVATSGRVEVNVVGLCKIGDLLVPSDMPGYAMSYDRTKALSGTILAKVIELTEDKNIVIAQLMLS